MQPLEARPVLASDCLSLSLCPNVLFFMEQDERDLLLLQGWYPDLALLWESVLTEACG